MVNIGIIGMGRIGKVHLESIYTGIPNAKVRTVADPFITDEGRAFVAAHGGAKIVSDYHDILNDKTIDAVLVCSSTDTHAPISLEAIAVGKNIFCEKPVDHDIAKIKEVAAALEGKNVKFQVGFNRRFDHNFKAVRAAILDGRIGQPHIVRITSRDPAPPDPRYIKVSGGMFMDMTIHDFDMACYLCGCGMTEVYAATAVLVDPEIGKQGDVDTAVITMKAENGAIVTIDNSRKAVYGYDQRAEAFGSGGMIATANDTQSTAIYSNADGVKAEVPLYFFLERYMQSFTDEMKQFIAAVENDTPTPVGIKDGLEAVVIAKAAGLSVKLGRPVKISEVL